MFLHIICSYIFHGLSQVPCGKCKYCIGLYTDISGEKCLHGQKKCLILSFQTCFFIIKYCSGHVAPVAFTPREITNETLKDTISVLNKGYRYKYKFVLKKKMQKEENVKLVSFLFLKVFFQSSLSRRKMFTTVFSVL